MLKEIVINSPADSKEIPSGKLSLLSITFTVSLGYARGKVIVYFSIGRNSIGSPIIVTVLSLG